MSKALIRSEVLACDEYVPIQRHVAEDVVLLDDQSRLAMFRLAGRSAETADPADVQAWADQLNMLCRNIASDRVVLYVHLVRGDGSAAEYPGGQFRSEFACRLDAAYRRIITSKLYRNDLFLSVRCRPPAVAHDRIESWIARRRKVERADPADAAMKHLRDVQQVLAADLAAYGLTPLGIRREGRILYSELGEALALILGGKPRKVPLTTRRLGRAIHVHRVVFGRETAEIREDAGSTFISVLGLKEYPPKTWPGQLDALLAAPFFFTLTQSFGFLAKPEAMTTLTRKQNQMVSADDRAYSQRDELTEAADRLQSNDFVMGSHHTSLTLFAETIEALGEVTAHARSMLADCGAVVVREDLALEAAFWAQLPGNEWLRPRPGVISSINWAASAPLHNYPTGERRGYWGEPVALLRSSAGTPVFYQLHVADIGNTAMFGPTGSGKTVLLLAMLAQCERLGATIVFFDKDRGGEILARALGGTYLVLPSGRPSGLAPLRALTDSREDIGFLSRWIAGLIAAGGYTLTREDEKRIAQGLSAMMRLAPAERSLSELRAFLGQADLDGAGARLEKWCRGKGELGWAFDGEADRVSLDAPFLGFDMTALLDDPDVRGPAMAYLFHRIEALVDGRRLVVAIDEFWKALADPAFRGMVNDKLKTIRKRNGALILATQSPRDALSSPISHTLIEQCPSMILMPNARADEADYRDGLKLTEPEFRLIRDELTIGGRRFLLKQGVVSVVCDFDLSEAPDCLAVLSGRESTVRLLDRIIAETGDDPADWLSRFVERVGEAAA